MNYEIKIIRSIEEVEQYRYAWEKLQWHPDGDIDRYLDFVKSRKEILRPHIQALFQNGSLISLMVGRIENVRLNLNIGYKTILEPKVISLTVGYGGILGESSEITCNLMMSALISETSRGEADVIFLQAIRNDSILYNLAKNSPKSLCRDHYLIANSHWRLNLPSSYAVYFDGLSKKTRARLRNESNRIYKKFGEKLSFKCYRQKDDIDIIMKDQEIVANKTYHRGLGVGFIGDDQSRQRRAKSLQRGLYRSYILYLDGSPVAFLDGSNYGKVFYDGTTGYDPEYQYYHFGTLLLMKIIENLCEEKLEVMDFGLGDAEYKRIYCNESWQETDFHIFAPTAKGFFINCIRYLILSIDQLSRRILKRYNLEGKIKKVWRDYYSRKRVAGK